MTLNKEKIIAELDLLGENIGWKVFCFEQLSSTNSWLLEQTKTMDIHGYVCVADSQTAGVGRSGKQWLASDSSNILMSVAYRFDLKLPELSSLSLITGIALVDVLEELGVSNLAVKWPNDVYLGDEKLAGILIQTQKCGDSGYMSIIGIGLNIELDQCTKQQISQPVADLSNSGLAVNDRELIIAKTLWRLKIYFDRFAQNGLKDFVNRWNQIDYLKDQKIVLSQVNQHINGKYLGISDEGALLIKLPDKSIEAHYFGEISVRRESSL